MILRHGNLAAWLFAAQSFTSVPLRETENKKYSKFHFIIDISPDLNSQGMRHCMQRLVAFSGFDSFCRFYLFTTEQTNCFFPILSLPSVELAVKTVCISLGLRCVQPRITVELARRLESITLSQPEGPVLTTVQRTKEKFNKIMLSPASGRIKLNSAKDRKM